MPTKSFRNCTHNPVPLFLAISKVPEATMLKASLYTSFLHTMVTLKGVVQQEVHAEWQRFTEFKQNKEP
jgi:hypothetical protein